MPPPVFGVAAGFQPCPVCLMAPLGGTGFSLFHATGQGLA